MDPTRLYRILLSTEGGEGGGEAKPAAPPAAPDPVKALRKQHGSDEAIVRAVLAERDAVAAKLAETTAKLPKDGHMVIDPDRAKLLADYEGLGLKPADLAKALGERDELGKKVTARERQDFIAEVAGLVKWKPTVLGNLAKDLEIVVKEDKDPKDATKTIKVPYVKTLGKGDDPKAEIFTPLTKHAEAEWGDYLPALSVEPPKLASHTLGSPPASGGPPRPPVVNSDQPRRSFVS